MLSLKYYELMCKDMSTQVNSTVAQEAAYIHFLTHGLNPYGLNPQVRISTWKFPQVRIHQIYIAHIV